MSDPKSRHIRVLQPRVHDIALMTKTPNFIFSTPTPVSPPKISFFTMVNCACGLPAIIRTSWTSRNPGRRFYCCPKKVSFISISNVTKRSPYFLVEKIRCMDVIPGILRSKNELEASKLEVKATLKEKAYQTAIPFDVLLKLDDKGRGMCCHGVK
ncbi:hypothetical protein OSB04_027886 [Centaurea solstitialis]|uniref:GRF-type domain-containing protein n=1 Tax=Centaurea solstitialis TaxID=347529 RepID=A0AA38SEN7_9ASTR|nr:hypothetical protein OSB04_027886 [Centaurea solstitialis]